MLDLLLCGMLRTFWFSGGVLVGNPPEERSVKRSPWGSLLGLHPHEACADLILQRVKIACISYV